jgi:Sulfotransferase family
MKPPSWCYRHFKCGPLMLVSTLVAVHILSMAQMSQRIVNQHLDRSEVRRGANAAINAERRAARFSGSLSLRQGSQRLFEGISIKANKETEVCLTMECFRSSAERVARTFPASAYNDTSDGSPLWCVREGDAGNGVPESGQHDAHVRHRGLLLVKVPKAASSTSAGVALRILHMLQCRDVQWMHRRATEYSDRDKHASFIFTTVRDPASRAVSSIFFHIVSRIEMSGSASGSNQTSTTGGGMAVSAAGVSDALVLKALKENTGDHYGAISAGQGGFQLRYTSFQDIPEHSAWNPDHPALVLDPQQVERRVQETLAEYSFVIVTERMDESLVCLALLMGVDVGTVLVTSSKVAGSRYHLARKAGQSQPQCLPTVKSTISKRVQTYLDSDEWRASNYGDYLLWMGANASLDRTIEALGRERFDAAMREYTRLRDLEQRVCAPHVVFPCSDSGVPQTHLSKASCYLRNYDFGCGFKCIDEMLLQDASQKEQKAVME